VVGEWVENMEVNFGVLGKCTWGEPRAGETVILNEAANGNGPGDKGNGVGLFKIDLGTPVDAFRKNCVVVGETMDLAKLAADIVGRI
jgi:hypothetical protein